MLWTIILPTIEGSQGIAGGYIVEPLYGHDRCYVVWVGWDSPEVHERYHGTKHFRKNGTILQHGNEGFREYGHVAFTNSRSRPSEKL